MRRSTTTSDQVHASDSIVTFRKSSIDTLFLENVC